MSQEMKTLADIQREVDKAHRLGKIELLAELIRIFEDYKDEIMTGNVILLELTVRLRILNEIEAKSLTKSVDKSGKMR